ncbi:MAG: DUF1598 domain-containing protein [Planctomycetaceae bacterium]|nr:DUF1598 domain-containing protein [Planctomycetaceae bacterium]
MKKLTLLLWGGLLLVCLNSSAWAQYYGYTQAIGGVSIDRDMVKNATQEMRKSLKQEVLSKLQAIPEGLDQVSSERKVSLKKMDAALKEAMEKKSPVPDSVRFLGGLTSIHYVAALPEENDIVLVGPAEGWTVGDFGTVIGKDSGKPILLLEDLITVFRTWNTSQPELISCSIDPTPEGRTRLNENRSELRSIRDPETQAEKIRDLLGAQAVTLTGVPADSRYANIMVAADYRMKRIGLKLDPAPISRFPSYVEMVRSTRESTAPRFWMVGQMNQIKHDESKMVWDMGSVKIITLTAREHIDQSGNRAEAVKTDAAAKRWADMMTKRYNELADVDYSFAELRNCVDLAGVVAVVYSQQLHQKVNCPLPTILNQSLKLPGYNAPKTVATEYSIVQPVRGSIFVGCGGVEVNPMSGILAAKQDNALAEVAERLNFTGDDWWSN